MKKKIPDFVHSEKVIGEYKIAKTRNKLVICENLDKGGFVIRFNHWGGRILLDASCINSVSHFWISENCEQTYLKIANKKGRLTVVKY